ncbi:MAG TPA: DinB family protein [Meiothermus sp.]|nr:DinB family protein [Meiothermus sp.]
MIRGVITPEQALKDAVYGKNAFAEYAKALCGLDAPTASQRPAGSPHSIWQLVWHLNYWQEATLMALQGEKPQHRAEADYPAHPEAPSQEALDIEVRQFLSDLETLSTLAADPGVAQQEVPAWKGFSKLAAILLITNHNAYHLGQVVLLRRMLGTWEDRG